jgi:hypothetical protein
MIGLEFPGHLNQILGDVTGEEYATARSVVEGADTLQEAVEASGVLDRLDSDAGRAEARAVLDGIPPALDEAIIAALESAFERRMPVEVVWLESENELIEVRLSEEQHGDVQRVRIVFVSPPGDWFPR